jgi:hypothetical protein
VKLLHLYLRFAKALTSLQVFPVSVISPSIVLLQVFLGRPLLLASWWFQSNTPLSIVSAGFLKLCPIHLDFLFLIWMSICSCFVISHRSYLILFLAILCLRYVSNTYLQSFVLVVCSCLFLILSMFHGHKGERILQ